MRSDRSQANLLVVLLVVALHKRKRDESRAFSRPGAEASVTSVPVRGPHSDSANSAASRLIKNHSANHDARYNDFAG
jgi:hypothetical protein